MEQPQVKNIDGGEYAVAGSKSGHSHLPTDGMARMNTSAHQGLAMSAVIQNKQSLNLEAPAKDPAANFDTGKPLAMPRTQRGPVASTFRPLPKISKANDQGSVNSLSLLGITAKSPMEAEMVRLFNFMVTSGDFQRLLMVPNGSTTIADMLANMGGKVSSHLINSASGAGATDNGDGNGNDNGGGSGDGAASSTNNTTTAVTTSNTGTNTGTPLRRHAAGGGGGGGTPRKKPASHAGVEKRGSCERCKKSKAKCKPIAECIRCAKDGIECSLKQAIMQDTGRRLGACQRCRKQKVGCKKVEACGRCHKAEQPCSWATAEA